jgi:hypothetical protein
MPAPPFVDEEAFEALWEVLPDGEVLAPFRPKREVEVEFRPALVLKRVGEAGSRLAYLHEFADRDYPRVGEYVREDGQGKLYRLSPSAETQPP